LELIN